MSPPNSKLKTRQQQIRPKGMGQLKCAANTTNCRSNVFRECQRNISSCLFVAGLRLLIDSILDGARQARSPRSRNLSPRRRANLKLSITSNREVENRRKIVGKIRDHKKKGRREKRDR
eukprot:622302-Amorphochlora_amoeboformis.AAC.1